MTTHGVLHSYKFIGKVFHDFRTWSDEEDYRLIYKCNHKNCKKGLICGGDWSYTLPKKSILPYLPLKRVI